MAASRCVSGTVREGHFPRAASDEESILVSNSWGTGCFLGNRLRRLMCGRHSAFPLIKLFSSLGSGLAHGLLVDTIRTLMRYLWNVRSRLLLLAIASFLLLAFAGTGWAQPAGGKTSDMPKTPAKTSTPAKSPAKPAPKMLANSRSTSGAAASIDGKWWTSGNDFGASEVVFTQTGSNVSGVIRYADGRTGSVNGTMVGKRLQHTWSNSSGESGSGWLELSWNNFLGGPWHNQKVRRIMDPDADRG
jgi:hypothetical protein